MKLIKLRQLVKEELRRALKENTQTTTLKNLTLDDLEPLATPIILPGIDKLTVNLPLAGEGLRQIDLNSSTAQNDFNDYIRGLVSQLGKNILNAPVILNPSEEWFKKVIIDDENFKAAKEKSAQAKGAFLSGERGAGRMSGLD